MSGVPLPVIEATPLPWPPPRGLDAAMRRSARLPLLPLHLAVAGLCVLILTALIVTGAHVATRDHDAVTLASGVILLALVFYARYALGFPWLSATWMYLLLLWIFHFGLAFTAVVDPSVLDSMHSWEVAWLFLPNARLAMLLAALGGAGFVIGAAFFAPGPSGTVAAVAGPGDGERILSLVGWALMLAGIALSLLLLLVYVGAGLFSVGYLELMSGVMQETPLSLAMDAAELGCLLAICGATRSTTLRPLFAWLPFGGLLLMLGMRNEALVPLAAFAVVLTHRGVRFRRSVLVSGVLILLVVIPVVKNVRTVGLDNRAEVGWEGLSPIGAFTEFGSTLRAASVYIDWIDAGERIQMGAGYWAPIDRQVLVRLMPWRTAPAFENDERIPSRKIQSVGAIGLSATGEAYYNFGAVGPFLFYGFVGALLAWLELRASDTPYRAAMLGIAMLVLFFNIRGSWLPVPGRAGIALALLAACHLLARRRRQREPTQAMVLSQLA